ncbi:MAG: hypothetical protein HKN21_08740 [Candidatus Eisenbacteria bacterium]|uniref:Heparin-sulfate lyase N-terminal domain-containing protein n=1 Tax=Eiseniibacteriota bacterium TaxID=2212470 RepID=A0A7Y2E909_UNCEI|nr:hypothetical protein [Candidatus Eisenbacteria bacterium]
MIGWYLQRLRAMGAPEIRHRAVTHLRNKAWLKRFQSGGAAAVTGPAPVVDWNLFGKEPWLLETLPRSAVPQKYKEATRKRADAVLKGTYFWLDEDRVLPKPIQWTTEPVSKVELPLKFFAKMRASDSTGRFDLKHLWELNIHTAFVTLAKAAWLFDEPQYRDELLRLWESWFEQNPPLCGPNYLAPIETGLRLMHWRAALHFLPPADLDAQFLQTLWEHIHAQRVYILANLSMHSSANNHLIGELASLVLTDYGFPGLAPADQTERLNKQLHQEVMKQFHVDGGNKEQALHYHAFSMQFPLLCAHLAHRRHNPWPEAVLERLEEANTFLKASIHQGGAPFVWGDSDDSEVLPLSESKPSPYLSTVSLSEWVLRQTASTEDERVLWLGGPPPEQATAFYKNKDRSSAYFFESGHVFLRSGHMDAHFNAGGLGYLSIAAHGHADALSLQIAVGGEPVISDPGTHTYRGGDPWREPLVSSGSHPTLHFKGESFAKRGGPFLWRTSYGNSLLGKERSTMAELQVPSGRLGRTIAEVDGMIAVMDRAEAHGKVVRLVWPTGPWRPELTEDGAILVLPQHRFRIRVEGFPGSPTLEIGSKDNPGSPCYSVHYDDLNEGHALVWEAPINGTMTWQSTFSLES